MTGQEGGDLPGTFAASVAALQARGRFGIRLGLGRTRALLAALDHPEAGIRGALIGGTNGKGSVVALVSSCLAAQGYRAGETPKPHLVSYRERIRIAGRPISADDFVDLVRAGLPVADRVARRLGPPTEFELLTALAFRHFADSRVDLAVVEVGLGGRLDATHAWDGGVAVITNVDLDHTEHLIHTPSNPCIIDGSVAHYSLLVNNEQTTEGEAGILHQHSIVTTDRLG